MDMILKNTDFTENGIFGTLTDIDGNQVCVTLQPAYAQPDGSFAPKLPPGEYLCLKGTHTLDHHPAPFQAFEVLHVPGHTNILFHIGNYNRDSDGCVLLGTAIAGRDESITESRVAFSKFMTIQNDVNTFKLTVV